MQILRASKLDGISAIAHGFFGRSGGVSEKVYATLNCGPGSADLRANVIENRRRVAEALAPGSALVTCGQVHGIEVIDVTKPWPIGARPEEDANLIPSGDAMVTRVPGIVLGILTADCAPVLLADAEAGVIGAAHAGWKGALAGVVEAVLAAMERLGARTSQITAAVGPCISRANYEVGPEFFELFLSDDSTNARFFIPSERTAHHRFDLQGYVTKRLAGAGVANIELCSACTYACEADFFSFRRATHRKEPDNGRQISAILLRK